MPDIIVGNPRIFIILVAAQVNIPSDCSNTIVYVAVAADIVVATNDKYTFK